MIIGVLKKVLGYFSVNVMRSEETIYGIITAQGEAHASRTRAEQCH